MTTVPVRQPIATDRQVGDVPNAGVVGTVQPGPIADRATVRSSRQRRYGAPWRHVVAQPIAAPIPRRRVPIVEAAPVAVPTIRRRPLVRREEA